MAIANQLEGLHLSCTEAMCSTSEKEKSTPYHTSAPISTSLHAPAISKYRTNALAIELRLNCTAKKMHAEACAPRLTTEPQVNRKRKCRLSTGKRWTCHSSQSQLHRDGFRLIEFCKPANNLVERFLPVITHPMLPNSHCSAFNLFITDDQREGNFLLFRFGNFT